MCYSAKDFLIHIDTLQFAQKISNSIVQELLKNVRNVKRAEINGINSRKAFSCNSSKRATLSSARNTQPNLAIFVLIFSFCEVYLIRGPTAGTLQAHPPYHLI
jgi:ABC-type uncharacterized transport system ATPase subunit